MKHFFLVSFAVALLPHLKAQTGIFYGMPVEQKSATIFADCQLFGLETLPLEGYLKNKNYAGDTWLMIGEKYDERCSLPESFLNPSNRMLKAGAGLYAVPPVAGRWSSGPGSLSQPGQVAGIISRNHIR